MEEILKKMYADVEKLADREENKELLKAAIQDYNGKQQELQNIEGDNRKIEAAKEMQRNEETLQNLKNRLAEHEKEIDAIEIDILKGKYQIESQIEQEQVGEQETILASFNEEIDQLQEKRKELEAKKAEAMQNIQQKIDQYYEVRSKENPQDVKDFAENEMNALDANRANVEDYYAEQFSDIDTQIKAIEDKKTEVFRQKDHNPILEEAKEIANVVSSKDNRLVRLQALAQKGKNRPEAPVQEENEAPVETIEEAPQEEQQKMGHILTGLGTQMPIGNVVDNATTVETPQNVIPKEKGDTETMQPMHEEAEGIKKQKVERITIDVSMGKVFIMLEPREEEQDKKYKLVEKIEYNYDQEQDLLSVDLMEEQKMTALKKHIPEFAEAIVAMDESAENKEAIATYQSYMEKFQDVDPIVISALDKMDRSEAIQEYVEAVSQKNVDKMPFSLDYDLRRMQDAEFNLAEKENILSYAKANKVIADDIKGMGSAGRHIRMRKFEQKHPWIGKMMAWLRAEDTKAALPSPTTKTTTQEPEFKIEKVEIDHEKAMQQAAEHQAEKTQDQQEK